MLKKFKKYKLRKPFSRQIRLSPLLSVDRQIRRDFIDYFGDILASDPLAASLGMMAYAYENNAGALAETLSKARRVLMSSEVADLLDRADLRKYQLAAFREYFREKKVMEPSIAKGLLTFSKEFDPKFSWAFSEASTSQQPRLREFEKVTQASPGISISIFFRHKFYPGSRPHDLPYRFASGLESVGAKCTILDPDIDLQELGYSDITLVDDTNIHRKDEKLKRNFLESIRTKTKKLVMLEMDPWGEGLERRIKSNRDIYDLVWAMSPDLLDQDDQIFGLDASVMLFPCGAPDVFARHRYQKGSAPAQGLKFCGGVEEFNFPRYFWLLSILERGDLFDVRVTNHDQDNKTAADSFDDYLFSLSDRYGCLNFLKRSTGEKILVGRTSDALNLGVLLVQEQADIVSAYLRPGEHFLEFSDPQRLIEIGEILKFNPKEFEDIRLSGEQFFQANYSDQEVLKHMCSWL
ncbi:MAG: glycosyltransferase [Alphaproteobacteria bacterium]